jgi:hypothetical protein
MNEIETLLNKGVNVGAEGIDWSRNHISFISGNSAFHLSLEREEITFRKGATFSTLFKKRRGKWVIMEHAEYRFLLRILRAAVNEKTEGRRGSKLATMIRNRNVS